MNVFKFQLNRPKFVQETALNWPKIGTLLILFWVLIACQHPTAASGEYIPPEDAETPSSPTTPTGSR